MEHTTPVTFPEDETFDIGQDTRTPLALIEYRYDVPFKFTGKIDKLTFKLEPEQNTKAKRLAHEEHRNPRGKQSEGANDPATRFSPITVAVERAIHCSLDRAGRIDSVIADPIRGVAGLIM